MAQIIKNRRGSINNVKDVTTQNAEILVASGSIGDLSGPFILYGSPSQADSGLTGVYKPASKIYQGSTVPTILSASYGNVLDGTPFYAVGNNTLYILSSAGNTTMNLAGNLSGSTLPNITASGSFSGSFQGNGSGLTNISASSVVGLNLNQIDSGSVTASVDVGPTTFQVVSGSSNFFKILNTGIVSITGSLGVTNGITASLLGTSSYAAQALSSSYALSASYSFNATTASYALNATTSSYALNATSASYASTAGFALTIADGLNITASNILVNQNLVVLGTASFGYTKTVTGSAVIIGDSFIILNADSPTAPYAGIMVYDTGSNSTASFEWNGNNDYWMTVEETGKSAGILTGPSGSKGSEVFPSLNRVIKGTGNNTVVDTNITDTGTLVSINSNTQITGSLIASAGITGSLIGTSSYADYATSASYALNATSASYALDATTASYALNATTSSYALNATSASYALNATSASYVNILNQNVTITGSLNITNGVTGSLLGTASYAAQALSSSYALSASYAFNATTASYALNATSASYVNILNQNVIISGSLNITNGVTGSLLGTASYVAEALTSSYALQATSASYALNAATASYVNTLFQNLIVSGTISSTGNISAPYLSGSLGIYDGSSAGLIQFTYMSAAKTLAYISPSQSGDLIQYSGSIMVASNLIDGGTF
jgi:hypothetical protein